MAEPMARVRVALRHQQRTARGEPVVKVGPLTIDLAARSVFLDAERLTLTPKEYRLLQILARHAGNVVTHQQLLKEVWGAVQVEDTHYLRIFVRKLRQKIEPDPVVPRILATEPGVEYRLAQSGLEQDDRPWKTAELPAKPRSEPSSYRTGTVGGRTDPRFLDRAHRSPP